VVVENSPTACADARANAPGAEVVQSEFERWTPERVPLVVADPARVGLGRTAVDVIAATGCHTLVLVSCDPVSLARDARLLAGHGFAHEGSTVLDLFPHTPHVEVVTRFAR
jgi:23S rRNA (uracil1939-C5)-methyltransferase